MEVDVDRGEDEENFFDEGVVVVEEEEEATCVHAGGVELGRVGGVGAKEALCAPQSEVSQRF